MDLISRQAAIDAVHKEFDECLVWDESGKHTADEVERVLTDVPSAQPEHTETHSCDGERTETHEWTPCSEETGDGYPEEDGLYYVTEQNYGFYLDADYKQRVTHTSHFKNGDFTDRFYAENNSNITAWMTLPDPYKESEE